MIRKETEKRILKFRDDRDWRRSFDFSENDFSAKICEVT